MMKKMYIADDDPQFIEQLADFIGDVGYEAYGSPGLLDLILLDTANLPDIFLFSIKLWGEDNTKIIIKYLKWNESTRGIPAILFSKLKHVEQLASISYADGFISFPLELNDLVELLNKFTSVTKMKLIQTNHNITND